MKRKHFAKAKDTEKLRERREEGKKRKSGRVKKYYDTKRVM